MGVRVEGAGRTLRVAAAAQATTQIERGSGGVAPSCSTPPSTLTVLILTPRSCEQMLRLERVGSTEARVTAEQVPALLLAALPSLSEEWAEVADDNADPGSPGGRLGYLDAAWVVGHLADRLAASETSEFDAAFDYIEHLILRGDPYV